MKRVLIDNICYTLDPATCTASICPREDDEKYVGDIVIPATITHDDIPYRVTTLGEHAFLRCVELTSIAIPNGVEAIGKNAFYKCRNLLSVIIPDSVTSIGESAFFDCVKLASLTISDSVNYIGEFAFGGCSSLTSITIPKKLTSIGARAFSFSCFTSITIPNSVTSIEPGAFFACKNLTSVTIASSVTSIGECAFEGCESLESVVVESGNPIYDSRNNCNAIIETATNTLIVGCKSTIIPDDVTSIGVRAFGCCKNLVSITIPSSVTSIGSEAFCECENLSSITIPDSVTTVGDDAFAITPWLDNQPAGPIYINTVLYGYKGDMPRNTRFTVRQGTLRISSFAFCCCENLISVIIPDSVTSIGESVFRNCKSLTQIVVEQGNPVYDSRNNCNAIIETATNTLIVGCKSTIIPNGVAYIGDAAFWWCEDLVSITIPNTVTSIKDDAFCGCTGLTSVIIPNGVTSIGKSAFSYCVNLSSITIPNSVISLGEGAFEYSGLTSIVIPGSVTSIGKEAFDDCESLMSITLPASIEEIGVNVLGCCDDNQQTIFYVPQGMTEKFCKMGLDPWRNQIVEINPQDDKETK